MRRRRAITPILSVIILMGIAITGGGILYGIQTQFLVAGLESSELRITELKMEKDQEGSCYLQAKVHNSGTNRIDSVNFETEIDSGNDFTRSFNNIGEGLEPRQSVEGFWFIASTEEECIGFTAERTYPVHFTAESSGGEFSRVAQMRVENVTGT